MAEMEVFVRSWPLTVIDVGGQEALLFSNGSWVFGEVEGLGLAEDGANVSLSMVGDAGRVVVVYAEDVFVVEVVSDVNIAVVADVDGIEALVMGGVVLVV